MTYYNPITINGLPELGISLNSPEFQRWLSQNDCFAFKGEYLTFKVRKRQRSFIAFYTWKRFTYHFSLGAAECIGTYSLSAAETFFNNIVGLQKPRDEYQGVVRDTRVETLEEENEQLKFALSQWVSVLQDALNKVPLELIQVSSKPD